MMASVSRPAVGAFPMRRAAFSGISMTCEAFAATAICREDVARREDTLEIPPLSRCAYFDQIPGGVPLTPDGISKIPLTTWFSLCLRECAPRRIIICLDGRKIPSPIARSPEHGVVPRLVQNLENCFSDVTHLFLPDVSGPWNAWLAASCKRPIVSSSQWP